MEINLGEGRGYQNEFFWVYNPGVEGVTRINSGSGICTQCQLSRIEKGMIIPQESRIK